MLERARSHNSTRVPSNSGFFVSNMVFRSAVSVLNMKMARLLGDLKL